MAHHRLLRHHLHGLERTSVRPAGYAHAADMYKAWARAVIDGGYDGPYERKYAVGCAFLRGVGHVHPDLPCPR